MLPPSRAPPPPPSPFRLIPSSFSSSAKLWPSDSLLCLSPDLPFRVPYAASTRSVGCTGGPCGACSLIAPAGPYRLRLTLRLESAMAPAVRCSPVFVASNKRRRKALNFSSFGPQIQLPETNLILDVRLRIAAPSGHGRSEPFSVDVELTNDEGLLKEEGHRRIKSAEQLHFEAVEQYCLRYENGDDGYYDGVCNNDVDAPSLGDTHGPAPEHSNTSDADAVSTPINDSIDSDASMVLPLRRVPSPPTGCNEKRSMQANTSFEREENSISSRGTTSIIPVNTNGNNGLEKTHLNLGNSHLSQASQDVAIESKTSSKAAGGTRSKGDTPAKKNLGNDKRNLRNEDVHECRSGNMDSKSDVEGTNSGEFSELSEEQKIRMELNKSAAISRRNMRVCEDAVAEAQARGLAFPKFESLLVEKSWFDALKVEFQKPYMDRLHQFVSQEAAGRIPIYPPPAKLFNAFNSCPFDKVKVAIIGQDPYHGPGQAMGLCFSVEKGIKMPSSLTNILLEVESDLHCDFPTHGNLEKWAYQGVLLLNTVLTVRDRHANSHAKKGWELFTDAAIRTLAQQRSGLVFLLWGNQAQEKLRLINKTCHHVLKAFHPSGISAHKGFFKCRHFSKTNQLLVDQGLLPIDWQL